MSAISAIADLAQDGSGIVVTANSPKDAPYINRIPGAKRVFGKGKPPSWSMPATQSICAELRSQHITFSEALSAYAARLERVQRYIERMKTADYVEPLRPIPIKEPYKLFQHQIRAYNIALALFGRGSVKQGGSNEENHR